MQFILIAYDAKDEGALERRLKARPDHVKICDEAYEKGYQLMGVALKDDAGKMIGSVMLFDVPALEFLENWVKTEPYVVNNVWGEVKIHPCALGPTFEHIFKK